MFDQLLTTLPGAQIGIQSIFINMILATLLGIYLAVIYKKTHKTVSYSQSFSVTLVLLPVITAIAMMVIGNNVVTAFALLGTFTIIRYRTALKDTKDTAFVFAALIVGLGVGTLNYSVIIFGTILLGILMLLLDMFNFGASKMYDYILTFHSTNKAVEEDAYQDTFDQYLRLQSLLQIRSIGTAKQEFTFNIAFKNQKGITKFRQELESLTGVSDIELLSAQSDIEY
ncbi:hypothetical protein COV81_03860 [Candidatus Peregrinibacteria bacterium CG11_big_fil_rev_8_21_14_0_20_41_10]|nr:MAG: hypothetical protein COV81_03860 [Candidatus Peregrinibacteria bacterium CG11_big_fil_rev_8_21_14_0_20_41_10]PIZ74264.1 MAG: hypothetical protein COY06_04475 [Candidatus Peregrinibacteria bacterium CG_4_10_14_0_2_um_filter_41_8]PJC38235.1 MAG: hypothetical protein CO045_01300 [Candidatus Peregrinibacteria bacterium CG_4_9_14_0_2_um_filter_41_14]